VERKYNDDGHSFSSLRHDQSRAESTIGEKKRGHI
jgi:hypothetical protein